MKVVYFESQQQQNHLVLEKVLAEHEVALKRFLRVRLALEEDREDIIQDVMTRLARMDDLAAHLQQNSASVRNYLITIAANLITDRYRRAQVRQEHNSDSFDELEHSSDQDNPESQVQSQQTLQQINHTLGQIKPSHKQAFLANRVEQKSYRQISEEMGVSISTVERYISMAVTTIRKKVLKL